MTEFKEHIEIFKELSALVSKLGAYLLIPRKSCIQFIGNGMKESLSIENSLLKP